MPLSIRNDLTSYEVHGPEIGKPVVLVHGIRLSRKMWAPQISELSKTYRVIAIDLPGHGTLKNEPFSLDRASEQLSDVIKQAAGDRALVVGLSLGGYVSMDLASRHPEQVAGLVLAGCTANPNGVFLLGYRLAGWFASHISPTLLQGFNAWLFRRMFGKHAESVISGGFYFASMYAAINAIAGKDFSRRLSRYPGASLIVNGERDHLFRQEEDRFFSAAQNPSLQIIPGARHLTNLEHPQTFNHLVDEFAASIGWR